MTRVCLVGTESVDLRFELLSRDTAREALSSYRLAVPYRNTLLVETISIGAAVSLLNDLNWYLVRFADDALVLEPSVSETEWLSRSLATAVRDGDVDPAETGTLLKIYGVAQQGEVTPGEPHRDLVEPMFAQRLTDETPGYDLREVDDTLVVRVTEAEYSG